MGKRIYDGMCEKLIEKLFIDIISRQESLRLATLAN